MAQDPLIGYLLAGQYRVLELVREEMLGRVYTAETNTGEIVDVKVLPPRLMEDPEAFDRFMREMMATAAVEHDNSVRMLDFGEHRIFHYIVMERIVARSLADEIGREGRLPWQRVVHIAAQVAACLDTAHAQGVVHRNLHSGNILLLDNADGDYVKVRDFGLARLESESTGHGDGQITAIDQRVGHSQYMAPEYIAQGIVSPSLDLYALGILMYEMLVGTTPFQSSEWGTSMELHLSAATPTPADSGIELPTWLNDVVVQLMAKEAELRPASAAALVEYLVEQVDFDLSRPALIDVAELEAAREEARASATPAPRRGSVEQVSPLLQQPIAEESSGAPILLIAGGLLVVFLLGTVGVAAVLVAMG